jgi:hypothetical protein
MNKRMYALVPPANNTPLSDEMFEEIDAYLKSFPLKQAELVRKALPPKQRSLMSRNITKNKNKH